MNSLFTIPGGDYVQDHRGGLDGMRMGNGIIRGCRATTIPPANDLLTVVPPASGIRG